MALNHRPNPLTFSNLHSFLLTVFLLWSNTTSAFEINQPAPSCSAQPVNETGSSKQINIQAYKGKVVLIDFWATWCGPCLKSMPFFNHLHHQQQKNGLEILAINVDEQPETAKQFLQQRPVDYPVLLDPIGNCPRSFDVQAMPSSYLIDKSGNIRHIHKGFRDEDPIALSALIEALLKESQ